MLRGFLVRLLINAIAIMIIVSLFPGGIYITAETDSDRWMTIFMVALIFGIANATVKPLLKSLSCTLIFFTLGLFLVVINGLMFLLVAWLTQQFGGVPGMLVVNGFLWAVVGGIVMSLVGMVLERIFGDGKED